jgi:hypothetical protein
MRESGNPEIVKERRRVGVVFVELVPQAGNALRFHIACG